MIFYIESNFLLEIVLDQEHARAATQILELAEAGKVRLCCPAHAMSEPLSTLGFRRLDRKRLSDEMQKQKVQLSRTLRHASLVATIADLTTNMEALGAAEEDALHELIGRLLLACPGVSCDLTRTALQRLRGVLVECLTPPVVLCAVAFLTPHAKAWTPSLVGTHGAPSASPIDD